MFEGAVAAFLNRLLGRYVEDLDTEHFNVGIFSGDTCLTDLLLKPEALYQLGLPIKIQLGVIGKITLKIPWVNLFVQPVVLCIEDVYIVAVPETSGPYDSEIQKRLIRATKKKILDDLEGDNQFVSNFMEDILSSVMKNFQITVNNVHIRFEENIAGDLYVVGGICLQSLSVATTNNKWKPGVTSTNSTSIYQLMKIESLSVYLNSASESCFKNCSKELDKNVLSNWKGVMCKSLQTFGLNNQEFQFLIKPFTTKVKVIMSKNNNSEISRMLVDIVLQDIAMQISKQQYAAFCYLQDSLQRVIINRQHRKFRPNVLIKNGGAKLWWNYAYNAILEYHIRTYSWKYLKNHRTNYRKYKDAFMQTLLKPNDTELKLDLQKYEDTLNILNIVVAREHAKIEMEKLHPSKVSVELRVSGTAVRLVQREDSLQKSNSFEERNGCRVEPETNNSSPSKSAKTFDRKYNFTLANYCLSLLNNDKEILVISVTQFLTSIETRPDSSSFKISARAESFVIEGVSSDNDLVTIVTTDNVLTGNMASNFLAIDFEKSAVTTHCNYDLTATLEPIEITYYNYSVAELIKFFELNESQVPTVTSSLYKTYMKMKNEVTQLSEKALSRTTRFNVKLDMKGPYIVFPEHGTLQKNGYILICDFGRLTLQTELQPLDVQLEDATIMELEELLYDRLLLVLTDGQIIICHGGDDWREIRSLKESEFHIVPKFQVSITVACSIRPEYRILPRIKLNVSTSHIKFHLSENKIQLLMVFLNLLTIPSRADVNEMKTSFLNYIESQKRTALLSTANFHKVRSKIVWASILTSQKLKSDILIKDFHNCNSLDVERSIISSEISEEDLEQWFKSSNFSGFEDFVSPSNYINLLLRFVIGELSFHFAHNGFDGKCESYLILKLCNIYSEIAIMKYGFAVQSGLGTVLLADKTEVGITGSYLELISTDNSCEVFTMSYRKIRADCPDFKSYFKNVECSSVVNVGYINVVFHRCAFIKLKHFVSNIRRICSTKSVERILDLIQFGLTFYKKSNDDPPVPTGAIKLSYSIRLHTLTIKLCNKDEDLFFIKFTGMENDCIYNANERMILRAHLSSLSVEDLSDSTFYSKILSSEDDKVFDLKYVRHTPKLYKRTDIDTKHVEILTDGSFKLSVGKVNYVFISRNIRDCQRFLMPFAFSCLKRFFGRVKSVMTWSFTSLRKSETKLRLSIDLQGPILLLPQRKNSPTLLIFDIGNLSIENFFKKNELAKQLSKSNSFETEKDCNYSYIVDNILIKLKSMTLFRAIMTLTGNLEMQEPIIDGVNVRYDVKRKMFTNDAVQYDIQGSVDLISVNLAQKDLTSIFIIWEDNISKLFPMNDLICSDEVNLLTRSTQDRIVKKLEAFFSQDEKPFCEITTKLTFDGLHVNLFSDTDEVLSSPVRDLNQGLCRLSFDEATVLLDYFSDKSLNIKISIKTCTLEDIRKCSYEIQKIIQSPIKDGGKEGESKIYVSMPPALDVTFQRTPNGDICLDLLIEESQVNVSVSFFTDLGHYLINSIPHEQIDEGVVNEAYEDPDTTIKNVVKRNIEANYLKNNYRIEEQSGYSMSLRLRKPELWLYSGTKSNSHAILMEAELTIEKSRHKGSSSVVLSLSDIRARSKNQDQNLHWILQPCDIEFHRKDCVQENEVRVNVVISCIKVYLCVGVVNSIISIVTEVLHFFQKSDSNVKNKISLSQNDLWCPKEISRISYKNKDFRNKVMSRSKSSKKIKFCEIKPVSLEILFILDETLEKLPVIRSKVEICGSISDWDDNFNLQFDAKLCAFCYDINRDKWEPLIELCQEHNMNKYKPWQLSLRVYQAECFPLNSILVKSQPNLHYHTKKKKRKMSYSDDEINEDMVFIVPKNVSSKINDVDYTLEIEDDSDNTDDETSSEKLNQTFRHLLTMDSNDEEKSDSDESSKYEDEDEDRWTINASAVAATENNLFTSKVSTNRATHFVIHSKEMLNFTLSTNTISIIDLLTNALKNEKNGIPIVPVKIGKLYLYNNVGYPSKVEFLIKKDKSASKDDLILIATQSFPKTTSPTSVPGTPDSSGNSPTNKKVFPTDESHDNFNYNMSSCNENESTLEMYNRIIRERLRISVEGFENVVLYSSHMKSQSYNLVPLRPTKEGIRYHIVVETSTDWQLHKTIIIRSPLQIRNETSCILEIYYKKQTVEKLNITHVGQTLNPFSDLMRMKVLGPEAVYDVPLFVAYHCSIHVLPAYSEKYHISNDGIFWQDMNDNLNCTKEIHCKPKEESSENSVFTVKVICNKNNYTSQASSQTPEYMIKIVPPVVVHNKLPFPVHIEITQINHQIQIESGEKTDVYSFESDKECQVVIKINRYLGYQWTGKLILTETLEKKYVKMAAENCDQPGVKPFLLCVEIDRTSSILVNIYGQYWIINKTNLPLSIGESGTNTIYEIPGEELVILSQKENSKRRRSIRLKAQYSDWSTSFNLDGVGPMSLILCKDLERRRKYRIFVEMSVSRLSPVFTKIITFLPYFYIANKTKKTIRFMEENEEADLWNDLLPGQSVAFWPYTETMKMKVKWKNSQLVSECFDIMKPCKTVLHMDNGTAVCVEVTGGISSPYTIVFHKYRHGDAPVRVDNLCNNLILKINQLNLGQTTLIKPLQRILYTWDDSTKERRLRWNVYQGNGFGFSAEISKDGFGIEKIRIKTIMMLSGKNTCLKSSLSMEHSTNNNEENSTENRKQYEKLSSCSFDKTHANDSNQVTIYWVSYVEREQRVLMFTQDENIFRQVKSFVDPEFSEKEIFVSLAGVGLSLVKCNSSHENKELLYASLSDSAAHWEVFIGQKWKHLTLELSAWLEDKYARSFERAQYQNLLDINLNKMYMTKPFFGKMRRTYSPALWLHYRRSASFSFFQGYIHKLQIDNQCHDPAFPIVLYFDNKEYYCNTMENRKLRHCVEFQCLKHHKPNRTVYKELNILVEEFNLNLHQDFLTNIITTFSISRFQLQKSIAARLRKDLSAYRANLIQSDDQKKTKKHETVVEHMYISPINFNLKLLATAEDCSNMNQCYSYLDYSSMIRLLFDYAYKGIFEKEAKFKLPLYELNNHAFRNKFSFSSISNFYTGKILQQFNLLVLSIAVLGNPYDNVNPNQDNLNDPTAITYKDEAVEKLASEMAYNLGFIIVDSTTRTSILNSCDLQSKLSTAKKKPTLSEDPEEISQKVSTIRNKMLIEIEIELAFLGLLVQPVDSTHQEELKYFFKTLGKKIIRLMREKEEESMYVQYYSDLIADTIKRAQEAGFKFVSRVRLPRAISPYTGVDTYSCDKAKGYYLWNFVNKNYYSFKDSYWAHAVLGNEGKRIALVTTQRIFLLDKKTFWGNWNVEWCVEMCNIVTPPVLAANKMILNVNKSRKPTSPDTEWYIDSKDDATLKWLCQKIDMAMILNMENDVHLLKDEI